MPIPSLPAPDTSFALEALMRGLSFPQEAIESLLSLNAALEADPDLRGVVPSMAEWWLGTRCDAPLSALSGIAALHGDSPYALHMLFFLHAALPLRALYRAEELPEWVYWNSLFDLKCKLLECRANKGVWGTHVASWHGRFFMRTCFGLGRLQYEPRVFSFAPYEIQCVRVKPGDVVRNLHIPSSGPLTLTSRMDSYRKAYAFYRCADAGKPLVVVCNSWLLYPGNRSFHPKGSNILDFMADFVLLTSEDTDKFHDAWRVFGAACEKPVAEWPEETSLQRAYKGWLLQGGKTGYGSGLLVFDGEKLLTRQG